MEETRSTGESGESGENSEIREAGKFFSGLGGRFLVGACLAYAALWGLRAALGALRPELLDNANFRMILSALCIYGIGMPAIILLVRRLPAGTVERRQVTPGRFVVAAIMCYGVGIVSNLIGNMLTLVISIFKGGAVQNNLLNMTEGASMWLLVLEVVICAPLVEEYVFRKLIVDRTACYGQGTAVVVSGLMFGLFHGNLNQFAYAFTVGTFLAYLYVKTGNLKITITIHMILNFIGSVVALGLLQMLDMEEYTRVMESMDPGIMADYMMNHLGALAALAVFAVFVVAVVIAGIVLFIVALATQKFTFGRGAVVIPWGKKFLTVIGNAGMALYCIFWTGIIIWQLFW